MGAAAQAERDRRAQGERSTGPIYTTDQGGNIVIRDPSARVNRPRPRLFDEARAPQNAPEAVLVIEEGQETERDDGVLGNLLNPIIDKGLGLAGELERPFAYAGDVVAEKAEGLVLENQDVSAPSERTLRFRELGYDDPSIAEGARQNAADISREGARAGTREGLKLATGAPIKRLSSGTRLTKAKSGKKARATGATDRRARGGSTRASRSGEALGEQPRNNLGQFRSRTRRGQRIPGTPAVDDFAAQAQRSGFDVVGREVSVNTPFGQRRYDVVLRDRRTGRVHGVEVKSSQRAFDRFDEAARQQFAADRWVNRWGGDAVGKFEGLRIEDATKILWEP